MKPVLLLALALTANAGSIPITGAGTFQSDSMTNWYTWDVHITGDDGLGHSISLYAACTTPLGYCPNPRSQMGIWIDAQYFHPGTFSFMLGGGGYVTGTNDNGTWTETLVGSIGPLNRNCQGYVCTGSFQVMSSPVVIQESTAPEPTSVALLVGGLAILWHRRRLYRSYSLLLDESHRLVNL